LLAEDSLLFASKTDLFFTCVSAFVTYNAALAAIKSQQLLVFCDKLIMTLTLALQLL
jgi:hypothetical protein